jgi:formylmethanofuran dehydrogenase subunit E
MIKLFDSFPKELKEEVVKYRLEHNKSKNSKRNSKKTKKVASEPAKEYAYEGVKKLPLDTKRQVQSAMDQLLNVRKVSHTQIEQAHKKISKCAESYGLCTIVFNSKFERYLSTKNANEPKI